MKISIVSLAVVALGIGLAAVNHIKYKDHITQSLNTSELMHMVSAATIPSPGPLMFIKTGIEVIAVRKQ